MASRDTFVLADVADNKALRRYLRTLPAFAKCTSLMRHARQVRGAGKLITECSHKDGKRVVV